MLYKHLVLQKDQNECFMTLYAYPKVFSGTLLNESDSVKAKLEDIKRKASKQEPVSIKTSNVKNRLIPEEASEKDIQMLNSTDHQPKSLSFFLGIEPPSTTISSLKPKQNSTQSQASKKEHIQRAIKALNDLYDKYKSTYSEEDIEKFKMAFNVLNEFN